jgi:hypothetical protein
MYIHTYAHTYIFFIIHTHIHTHTRSSKYRHLPSAPSTPSEATSSTVTLREARALNLSYLRNPHSQLPRYELLLAVNFLSARIPRPTRIPPASSSPPPPRSSGPVSSQRVGLKTHKSQRPSILTEERHQGAWTFETWTLATYPQSTM